jgi:hypothetical protein
MTTKGVSIKPSDFSKGGFLDDEDVIFQKLRFMRGEDTDIENYPDLEEKLFVGLTVTDESGEEINQYYSAGVLEYFEPSEDGKRAVPVSTASTLRENCNFAIFAASIVNAGYPEDKLSDDISIFEGLHCHMSRVPPPKRSGLGEGSPILVVEKIHEPYPWDGAGKKAKAKPEPEAKSAPKITAVEASSDLAEKTTEIIMGILIDNDGEPIKKTSLFKVMLGKLAKNGKDRKNIIKLASDDDFLEAGDWAFDGTTLSLE